MKPPVRKSLVGLITIVVAAPISFVLFAMGLIVAEAVIYPTATLATAVITALIASWMVDWLTRDGQQTDLNRVVRRNLAWGILPALVALAYPRLVLPFPNAFLFGAILLWTAVTATRFASRHRREATSRRGRVAGSAAWLVGTGLATAAIIFVASLFGLTGA